MLIFMELYGWFMLSCVHLGFLLLIYVILCWFGLIYINFRLTSGELYVDSWWFRLIYVVLCWFKFTYVNLGLFLLILGSCMLSYADYFRLMLSYVHFWLVLCWFRFVYVDLVWFMLFYVELGSFMLSQVYFY